jgi:glycosyltransferase involved in cell wall biosynthesis
MPQHKERLIVFGGAVGRRKGVDVLMEAWRKVGPVKDWRLVVAGPIVDDDVVPDQIPDGVFVGSIPHSQLMDLLDRSLIAVLPSRDEAMPMFILEAMARDNCVISTNVGGIPDVLSDGRGILVDAGDCQQLVDALRRAMDDDEYRSETIRRGRVAFDHQFSSRAINPMVERVWLDALRRSQLDMS